MKMMRQDAPYPEALVQLVDRVTYRDGWRFYLATDDRGQDSYGLTLTIQVVGPDTFTGQRRGVNHLFIVPAASYNEASWRRWLFDRVLDVERHEAMEWFKLDGVRPYAPNHGDGWDPYMIVELTDDHERAKRAGE